MPECFIMETNMKRDKEKTKTIFRIWPNEDVIALFPQIAGNMKPWTCQSYMHVGQHGAATTELMRRYTRPAKPKEYKELLAELRRIGYNVQVVKRCTRKDYEIRQQQIRG